MGLFYGIMVKDCIILNNLAGLYIKVKNYDAATKLT
jgi:hypothetical protein